MQTQETVEKSNGRKNGNGKANGKREATPRSMTPATSKEQTGKLSQAVVVDIPELVAEVATRKASLGESFQGRRAGNSLKSAVCAALKVKRGVDASLRLPDEEATLIEAECVKFLASVIQRAESEYPEVVSVRLNIPTVRINGKTNTVEETTWQSRVTRCRLIKQAGDERVAINELLRTTKDRLDYMQGKRKVNGKYVQPKKTYTREEIENVELRISALEKRNRQLTSDIAKLSKTGKANGRGKAK